MSCCICSSKDECINCDSCSRTICSKCSGLTASEMKCMPLKRRILKFFCEDCREGLSQVPLLRKELSDLKDQIHALLSSSQARGSGAVLENPCSVEEVMNEVHQRNIRKNNLIVFGLEDHNDRISDRNTAHEILDLAQFTDKDKVRIFRIGKSDPSTNKTRPLKLIFEDETAMKSVLVKSRIVRENVKYRNLQLLSDRTPMQIEYYKRIKLQLEERRAAGENDIRIRYIHGLPKIAKVDRDLN